MALDTDIDLLASVPALSLLGPEALRILAISAQAQEIKADDTLYKEGEPADCGFVVASGAFALQRARDGHEGVLVRQGALLGETALMIGTTWSGSAIAVETSTVLRIPRTVFLRVLEGVPEGAERLRRYIAERLAVTIDEIDALRPRFESEADDHDDRSRH
ncbi:MAG TPA: cyclic nucleotide-binding domain-containing protein [Xanthobacteraceae bacterium]|jgi:CRP-like cAMP-binding protein